MAKDPTPASRIQLPHDTLKIADLTSILRLKEWGDWARSTQGTRERLGYSQQMWQALIKDSFRQWRDTSKPNMDDEFGLMIEKMLFYIPDPSREVIKQHFVFRRSVNKLSQDMRCSRVEVDKHLAAGIHVLYGMVLGAAKSL